MVSISMFILIWVSYEKYLQWIMNKGITPKDMRVFINATKDIIIYFIVETHQNISAFYKEKEKNKERFLNAMIGNEIPVDDINNSGFFNNDGKSGLYIDFLGKCADGSTDCFGRYVYIVGYKDEVFRIQGISTKNKAQELGKLVNEVIKALTIIK